MTRQEAAKLVNRLVAGFPNLSAHDPKGYIAALIEVMSEYPAWAGQRAILKVDEENSQFPPTDRSLRKWLEGAVRPYRFAQEWQNRSRKQIAERQSDEGQKQKPDPASQGQILSNFATSFAEHGRPFGPFDPGRQLPYDATTKAPARAPRSFHDRDDYK